VIVTISNRYGSGALAVAQRAAGILGYEYIDEQLPVVVAKRLRTSPEEVDREEDRGTSMSERMLRVLELATPEVGAPSTTFDEELLREVQQAVREYAAHDNVVIVGRGAHAILGRRRDVVRVFMYAPRDWRMRHLMETTGVDEKTASAEIDRIDKARAEYMRRWYELNWTDPINFDLMLDTSSFGFAKAADLIATAVREREE
jgi:cytidylate kinase